MASKSDTSSRNVIPDWKDFKTSFKSGELYGSCSQQLQIPQYPIAEYLEAWRSGKNIAIAGDLISAAIMNGYTNMHEVQDAAKYIMERPEHCTSSLLSTAQSIFLSESYDVNTQTQLNISDKLNAILNEENIYKERVRYFKQLIRKFQYNPIWYVELSRCYVNLGLLSKAANVMQIAIHLSPSSRFISRSAARLFLHIGDIDRAHDVLIHNPTLQYDPWLLASEIAINASRGRSSRFMKAGISMVHSGNYSPFSFSELASAIGTKELEFSRKKGKSFLEKSLILPNDNSLSQADWLVNNDKSLSLDLSNVKKPILNFESEARFAFLKEDYQCALENSIVWIEMMPFARTPVNFAADIAYTYQGDYANAIKILQIGLKANPKDLSFMNNLAYAYALNGQTKEADDILIKLLPLAIKEADIYICAKATNGLNEYRKGHIESGRTLYSEAINHAKQIGAVNLVHKALLNNIREEVRVNSQYSSELIPLLDKLYTGNERETNAMKHEIKRMLYHYKSFEL